MSHERVSGQAWAPTLILCLGIIMSLNKISGLLGLIFFQVQALIKRNIYMADGTELAYASVPFFDL